MEELILKLYAIGAIKLGSFEVRKNFISPFQIDLSCILSNGEIAKRICSILWEKTHHLSPEILCGGSSLGSCFANFIAWEHNIPLILLKDRIEGRFKTGQKCFIIQDRLLAGTSTLETIDHLEENGIQTRSVLAFIDMELGAKEKIKQRGFSPHSIITISEILHILFNAGKIPGDSYKLATDFLENE